MARNGEAHGAFYAARNHGPAEGGHPLMSALAEHPVETIHKALGPVLGGQVFGAVNAAMGGESHEGINQEGNPSRLGQAMRDTEPKGSMVKSRRVGKDTKPWKSFN